MIPVEICTDATFPRAMLSSLLPNSRDFTRLTCCGVTMIRTGNNRLPLVQRLAVKVSPLDVALAMAPLFLISLVAYSQRRVPNARCWSLDPLQRAFFPDPDVAHDEDEQENQDLAESKN